MFHPAKMQAGFAQQAGLIFGGLAVMISQLLYRGVRPVCLANCRPMALRPRLSTGLLLSDADKLSYSISPIVSWAIEGLSRISITNPVSKYADKCHPHP
jgi:hypothetical protein